MTPERLVEIKARAAKATEGPWEWFAEDGPSKYFPGDSGLRKVGGEPWKDYVLTGDAVGAAGSGWINAEQEDMEFIAHARTDVPDLVAEVEKLRAALDELVGIVNAHRRARGSDCCGCCDVVVNRIEERMFDWV